MAEISCNLGLESNATFKFSSYPVDGTTSFNKKPKVFENRKNYMSVRLANAAVSFHTNDEDKDHDTHVTVTVRDVNGLVCAQVDNDWGHFDDQSDAGPFGLKIRNRQAVQPLQSGSLTIRIDPNGHDTWRFNFNLVLTFDDGSTLAGGADGQQLSQNNKQQDYGLQGLLIIGSTGSPLTQANVQQGWKWCSKCQGLHFAGGNVFGICPAGGSHITNGSGDYTLLVNDPDAPGQSNWRWCNKCQGLHFGGAGSPGPCPAGGSHVRDGSGDYTLLD